MKTPKQHPHFIHYKENYETIKNALNLYASNLMEILHYEQHGISEKGLRSIIASLGCMRQAVFSNSKKNRDLYFHAVDVLEEKVRAVYYLKKK